MKKSLIGAVLLFATAVALPVSAAHHHNYHRVHDPAISERQRELVRMIERGTRSGDISQREARRLYAEQQAIRDKERHYRADGVLTRMERRDLMRDLTIAEQRIYNAMNNSHRHHAYRRF